MDEQGFGFASEPFSLTTDPTVYYRSRQHLLAEGFLRYALESQCAFSLLTGEIGCGKSLLVSRLIGQLGDDVVVGLINRPHGRLPSIHDLVAAALGIKHSGLSDVEVHESLVNAFQREYTKGRRTLLIIDEAQNLSIEVLEELRLLSNFNGGKNILQILLVGQPELRKKLNRPELKQFGQRIAAQYHLAALQTSETHSYISYRLQGAGGNPMLFTTETMDLIHASTGGVPRLINQMCHYALALAHERGRTRVESDLMKELPQDFCGGFGLRFPPRVERWTRGPGEPASTVPAADSWQMPGLPAEPPRAATRWRRPVLTAAAVIAILVAGGVWWELHRASARPVDVAQQNQNSPEPVLAQPSAPVSSVDSVLAPAPAVPPAATVAATAPVRSTQTHTHQTHRAADRPPVDSKAEVVADLAPAAPVDAKRARSVKGTWYLNQAIARLNAGDTAGAEHLMAQASTAGAQVEDVADLQSGIDAQKREVRLMAAGDAVRAAIASGSLLEPVGDSAESHYQEMLSVSSNDPLTLHARRELQGALLANSAGAIQKDQIELAQRLIEAASKLGNTAEVSAMQQQVREAQSRVSQQAPAAQALDSRPKENVAAETITAQVPIAH